MSSIAKQGCTSCEELESKLQAQHKEIESLQKQLNYWQNTTINILMKYPIDSEGEFESCTAKDELSLIDISQQIKEISNQTQGIRPCILHSCTCMSSGKMRYKYSINNIQLSSFIQFKLACTLSPKESFTCLSIQPICL